MTDTNVTTVSTSIVVNAPLEVAFTVFTEDMESWWPPDHHILQAALASMVFEPETEAASTTSPWTGASASGPVSWPTSLRIGSFSAGTSVSSGRSKPTPTERAKWKCGSSLKEPVARGSSWNTAGWIATAKAGRVCAAVGSPEGWDVGLQRFAQHVEHVPANDV